MPPTEKHGKFRQKLEQPTNKILAFILDLPPKDSEVYFRKIKRALRFLQHYGKKNEVLNDTGTVIDIMVWSLRGQTYRDIAAEIDEETSFVKQAVKCFERALPLAFDSEFLSSFNF